MPLVRLDKNLYVLELFHGPTLAFKDFGARFMAGVLLYLTNRSKDRVTILVATSGDTGGAVASAFYDKPGIDVIILYPSKKISSLQERQLAYWDKNITAFEIEGDFDLCQDFVKQALHDPELKNYFSFTSANSINIARLLPQSFYYFDAIRQLKEGVMPVFVVPSGNLGNLTAGLMAKKMGLPTGSFIAATNSNNAFIKYLESGRMYSNRALETISSSMDVAKPGNFPRLFHFAGSTWNMVKQVISGYSVSDEDTKKTIKYIYNSYNYISDPHTAVGIRAALKSRKSNQAIHIVLGTAHPAKFPDVLSKILNVSLQAHASLSVSERGEKKSIKCSPDYIKFKNKLKTVSNVPRGT